MNNVPYNVGGVVMKMVECLERLEQMLIRLTTSLTHQPLTV